MEARLLVVVLSWIVLVTACAEGAEDDADAEAETIEAVHVSIFVRGGLSGYCSARMGENWCHFADEDEEEGDRSIQGVTECQALGDFGDVGPGYSLTMRHGTGEVVGVAEIEERPDASEAHGIVDWDYDGQPSCEFQVAFTDVPEADFYTIEGDHDSVDFSHETLVEPLPEWEGTIGADTSRRAEESGQAMVERQGQEGPVAPALNYRGGS